MTPDSPDEKDEKKEPPAAADSARDAGRDADQNADQDADQDADQTDKTAADDPTAMWDQDALIAAGIEGLRPDSMPPTPATGPDVKGDSRRSVVVGRDQASRSQPRQPAPPPPSGLSWPLTIGLAIVLGAAVYFLVSLLR